MVWSLLIGLKGMVRFGVHWSALPTVTLSLVVGWCVKWCKHPCSRGLSAPVCRANFSYLPRRPRELRVDVCNVFHVLDDSPMMKGSFRVSRLNSDGTDAEQGIIPNSFRAQRYICEQGQGEKGWGRRRGGAGRSTGWC